MRSAAGDRSHRHPAELTDTHAETARRSMQGGAPSVEFVVAFCKALTINSELGEGRGSGVDEFSGDGVARVGCGVGTGGGHGSREHGR